MQNSGSGTIRAGVKFDAEQPNGINAKADQAFRITGFDLKNETLSPFIGLGLGSTALTEIAVHIEITKFRSRFAIFEECCARRIGDSKRGACV
ncbi:hypothetical protein D3C85_1671300 [compost metagenome]